ncbi:hypothetical protein GIB67_018950 [Kingdonia uniflora]|uniref:Major facilitator superfamily (MFS) profile domain-containing protein n=1 Tax=Kingdonia uniflora TaxID=39325 RepID=A0A7J7L2Q2_9MAGN|nr:hypothetical protein GIB67_018950 [Kingdonia uniflora]
MSGAILFIKDDLKIALVQQQILIGSLNIFSLFGALASGKTMDMVGMRYTIILATTTFLIGALLMGLAPSNSFLLAGWAIAGIGAGYSLMIVHVYTVKFKLVLLPRVRVGYVRPEDQTGPIT